jgi:hypothetical protein
MIVRALVVMLAVAGALASASEASSQSLTLHIEKGLVTLEAENVTVDEVLTRWSRITRLNVVSKTGTGSDIPLSLHLSGVPEREAMALLLKGLSGYIMGERIDPVTGLPTIDRLLILTQSAGLAPAFVPAPHAPDPEPEIDQTEPDR